MAQLAYQNSRPICQGFSGNQGTGNQGTGHAECHLTKTLGPAPDKTVQPT